MRRLNDAIVYEDDSAVRNLPPPYRWNKEFMNIIQVDEFSVKKRTEKEEMKTEILSIRSGMGAYAGAARRRVHLRWGSHKITNSVQSCVRHFADVDGPAPSKEVN